MCAMIGEPQICTKGWEMNDVYRMGHLERRAQKVKPLHV